MRLLKLIIACMLCPMFVATATDLVVIVNPASDIDKLSKDEVINIFMGRYRKLASGMAAIPIDLENPLKSKEQFYFLMMGKELIDINSYWARLKFSGQAPPPRRALNTEEMLEMVSASRGAIGYIDKKDVDKRVRVVLELPH
ncbi:ABC-type phosphate transport system substrate-binding protein [Oxalobacteraceae bacterium GrIS 1.11]